jgi:hypothetical protein
MDPVNARSAYHDQPATIDPGLAVEQVLDRIESTVVELAGAGVNAALALQTKANEVNPPVPIRLASLILTIGDPPSRLYPTAVHTTCFV